MEKTDFAFPSTMDGKKSLRDPSPHAPAIFKALIQHERSRSSRDGSEFSLAIFDVSRIISNNRGMKHVVGGIREKMRSIDEMGWLDALNIGVLLPLTSFQGGRRFVSRVSESAVVAFRPVSWTVFTYPAHWGLGNNNGFDPVPISSAWQEGKHNGKKHRHDKTPSPRPNHVSHLSALLGQMFCLRVPAWKRTLDIAGSLVMIVVLSPLLLLISASIKCISPGKILFRQRRVGYQGKLFTFLKFRTMHENSDVSTHEQHLRELIKGGMPMEKLDAGKDPRIIPGGRILRKASLDELPQLFNVLRGEMSLVGPRPCIPYEAEEYLRWHTHRFDILPGMTGLWQVSGKNSLSFEQMIRLDISYARRMSLFLDLKILLLTLPTVVRLVFEAGMRKIGDKRRESSKKCCYDGSATGTLGNA